MVAAVWLSAVDPDVSLPARGLTPDAEPVCPVVVIDLEPLGATPAPGRIAALSVAAATTDSMVIARCAPGQVERLQPVAAACAMTLVAAAPGQALPEQYVGTPEPELAVKEVVDAVLGSPRAATVLTDVLRSTAGADVRTGLFTESAAYSMLLGGEEFAAWRAGRPRRAVPHPDRPPVAVSRADDVLTITLDQPDRHNAFNRWMRDAACDALDVAILDGSIRRVRLRGAGASFCSGGDLDEFGSQRDVAAAHLIRLDRSVAWRLHRLADRAEVELHGACIGAGIELAGFAGRVVARNDTWFQLPEVEMGLIPGAGGTVSLPRRIGRWRTAWLAITGRRLDLATALDWGLVDDRVG